MLTEDRRKQLDGIVQQMIQNRENDDTVNFVVNDFKNKYTIEEPQKSFTERTAGGLDVIFGGGEIGEAIGTGIAKGTFGKTIQKAVTGIDLSPEVQSLVSASPKAKEILGSALQSASLFFPLGTVTKGLAGGIRAVGLVKGGSTLSKLR